MSGDAPVDNAAYDNAPAAEAAADATAGAAPEASNEAAAPQAPQDSTADAIGEVSAVPETLHMAARAGSVESVKMLIRNKADPEEKDKEGKTPLEYAQAAGKADVVKALKEALGSYDEEFEGEEEAPAAAPAATPAAAPATEPTPAAASKPAVQIDAPGDSLDRAIQEDRGSGYGNGEANNKERRWAGALAKNVTLKELGEGLSAKFGKEYSADEVKEHWDRLCEGPKPKSPNKDSKINEHKDLKARTMFSHSTQDGVLKRTTFIHKLSNYPSAPEVSIASRGSTKIWRTNERVVDLTKERTNQGVPFGKVMKVIISTFGETCCDIRYDDGAEVSMVPVQEPPGVERLRSMEQGGPSPGSYSLGDVEKTKFKSSGHFSFGGGSRFGLGQAPTKQQPGPGQYNPIDPSLKLDVKVGFGTSIRNRTGDQSHAAPGPGAYEVRSTVGGGLMFTARGRQPTSFMRSRSLPGPGAYTPAIHGAYQTSPKCGFGTSVRGELMAGAGRGQPGPGTYEMQNFKCLGKDSCKYSATSRRRMHDLNSYVTPGPGTYNAHATSFGGPGAYSCRHVDDGYNSRDALRKSVNAANLSTTA